ncbi:MAG: serine/threonine-protein kinase [Planctomycetota bacterium]|jgi:serine/threonine-protein kinase
MSEGAPGLGDASDSGHLSLQRPRVQALFGEPEVAEGVREASERIFGVDKDAERPLPEGTRLGPYRLDRLLGVGGQGFVYSARHTELGREVALKVPRRDIAESILREAQVAVSVSHEGVVRVEDVRTDGERPYLVMERMVGGSLAERCGPRPMAEVRAVGNAVLGALEFVHAQGVVHRDLKPANVLFDQDGRAKLSDLGIGVRPVAGLEGQLTEDTRSLTPMGTRLYAAPEQIDPARLRGAALDGRADLFSFGKLLFGMLTGEPPTTVRPPSRVRTGLDSGWDDFVFRLLEADREDRFPTAAATRKAFEELSISENDGGESISRPDSNS